MTAENVRRIAEEVVSGFDAGLEILAVIPVRGGSPCVELLVRDNRCDSEPCKIVVGASRTRSEVALRRTLVEQLQSLKQYIRR
jgi:ribosomal protein S12 methylthiotransferase accessory factor YcaO